MKLHPPVRVDTLLILAFVVVVAVVWGEDILYYFIHGYSSR